MWYYTNVGRERCPVLDTWWQTETGAHMITPLPGVTPLKPGSCTLPLPGIAAAVVDEAGEEVERGQGGLLVVKRPWPAVIRKDRNSVVSGTCVSVRVDIGVGRRLKTNTHTNNL